MVSQDSFFALGREQGQLVWFLGTMMELKASGDKTQGAFGLIEQVLSPGFSPPLHVHHGEDEAFYLLEGEATFNCGEETVKASPGTFVYMPRDIPHWFRIEGDQPARLLQFNFPAGVENFFKEVGEDAKDPHSPPAGPANIGKMASIAPHYQLEILGPAPLPEK